MSDIRFNSSSHLDRRGDHPDRHDDLPPPHRGVHPESPPRHHDRVLPPNVLGKCLRVSAYTLGFLVAITVLIYMIQRIDWSRITGTDFVPGAYSAVFLQSGQVYFGRMVENSDRLIVLSNIYYLQKGSNEDSMGLVKLGQELHGPKDELYINKDSVMFYEFLRSDSEVVETMQTGVVSR